MKVHQQENLTLIVRSIITEILSQARMKTTLTGEAIIHKIKKKNAEIEVDFFESFDASSLILSNMVKNEARNLVKEGKIKQYIIIFPEMPPHQEMSIRSW